MKVLLGFAALGWLAACSSSSTTHGPCGGRGGTYVIDYVERSGNCGPKAEQVATPMMVSTQQSACSGTPLVSADNCTVTLDTFCAEPGVGSGFYSETAGDVHWSEDGASAAGIIALTLRAPDDTIVCTSTYDVTFSRR